MKRYTVSYKETSFTDEVKELTVTAKNKYEAYTIAVYESGINPYSAWVTGYTTKEGKKHYFNTFEGKAY